MVVLVSFGPVCPSDRPLLDSLCCSNVILTDLCKLTWDSRIEGHCSHVFWDDRFLILTCSNDFVFGFVTFCLIQECYDEFRRGCSA